MSDESQNTLRQRINELESTVDGLVNQLMEATDRIEELEGSAEGSESEEAVESSADSRDSDEDSTEDDIIVA